VHGVWEKGSGHKAKGIRLKAQDQISEYSIQGICKLV